MNLAYYGDDFTGSTDALEQLTLAGWRTRLFTRVPDPATLESAHALDAVGIAGITRSLSPGAMEAPLREAFSALRALAPRHVHYKVCSTFDSSPTIGSIGKAIEVGLEYFPNQWVPLLVGAPTLGRYCVFGNLFARLGIGAEGAIHRLDRHPSMSRHPITPSDESDLRLHLARQTRLKIGLIDVLDLERPRSDILRKIDSLARDGCRIILFDALDETHLDRIGAVLEAVVTTDMPLFSVGSSSVDKALVSRAPSPNPFIPRTRPPDGRLLVLSGSRSPVTTDQIRHALDHGFSEVVLDVRALLDPMRRESEIGNVAAKALSFLRSNRPCVLHTSAFDALVEAAEDTARAFGGALGEATRRILAAQSIARIVMAGGDTSGHATRALGIEAVEMTAPLWPGAPICRAYSHLPEVDGTEIVLKGGQVGDDRFFTLAAEASAG